VTLRVIRIGFGVNPAGSNSNQPRDRIVFANEKKQVLYSSAQDKPGVSACTDECTKTWIPFPADANAKPVGQWTVIARADGVKQWAFRGMPMYTYAPEADEKPPVTREERNANAEADKQAGQKAPGNAQAGAAAVALDAANIPAAKNVKVDAGDATKNTSAEAKAAAANLGRQGGEGRGHDVDGHQVMELQPHEWMPIPAGIEVREVRTAPGQVLTTEGKGFPLYALTGKADEASLKKDWSPVVAGQLALPIGDFTVVTRKDGLYQWAYKGNPLYTYKGDLDYGDSNGREADPRLQLVYVMKYFTPEGVVVKKNHQYGGLFATADGRTLYARESSNGGSDGALRADRGRPATGEKIGVTGCDAECEKTWQPLLAADGAKPSGYWTLMDRPDGKKQWAYFGYALYSKAPGTPADTSTEIYDTVAHYEVVNNTPNKAFPLHWRVAPP
jgi:predicted lipoprotein with Yx(FWY)xxD motif